MKQLIIAIILALPVVASAQTPSTNDRPYDVATRWQLSTNQLAGWTFRWNNYKTAQGTNAVTAKLPWIYEQLEASKRHQAREADEAIAEKQAAALTATTIKDIQRWWGDLTLTVQSNLWNMARTNAP